MDKQKQQIFCNFTYIVKYRHQGFNTPVDGELIIYNTLPSAKVIVQQKSILHQFSGCIYANVFLKNTACRKCILHLRYLIYPLPTIIHMHNYYIKKRGNIYLYFSLFSFIDNI